MREYYEDKNMFPIIVGKTNLPPTLLCRINGSEILDGNFVPLSKPLSFYLKGEKDVIIKPSVGSSSGNGIVKFTKQNDEWHSCVDGRVMDTEFLLSYGKDFVLQPVVLQHSDMAVLNHSSVKYHKGCRVSFVERWKTSCVKCSGSCREKWSVC